MATPKEIITGLYEAFGRGDADTVLGMLDESVDWKEAEGGPLAIDNPYTGPQAVAGGVFAPILSDFEDFRVSPHLFVAEGGEVVALGRYTGTHRESGDPLDAQFAHHWSLKHGKIVAFQQYTDTAQWSRVYAT